MLVVREDNDLLMFNDASALFPIFYVKDSDDKFYASSSERTLVEALLLPKIANEREFSARPTHLSAETFLSRRAGPGVVDTWWPLFTTPYEGLCRLLPHHVLDMPGQARRIWPVEPIERLSFERATEKVAASLKAVMVGVSEKYDHIRLPITAGLDSRILLAAARSTGIDARCYTYGPDDVGTLAQAKQNDMKIGRKVAAAAEFPHDAVSLPQSASLETIARMTSNVDSSIAALSLTVEHEALGEYAPKSGSVVSLNGNISEIASMEYGRLPTRMLSGHSLATITKTATSTLAISTYAEWLKEMRNVSDLGYNALDILYWEDRIASWQATVQQQMTQIWAVITPFNCQAILETMLSVPESCRRNKAFPKELIRLLDPDLLSIPVNPLPSSGLANKKARAKRFARRIAREHSWLNVLWWRLRNKTLRR